MRKISTCIVLGIIMITMIPIAMAFGEDVNTETHKIVISTDDRALSIVESLRINGTSNETYSTITFWITDNAQTVNILVNSNQAEYTLSGNEYICNISALNITMNTSIQVTISYTLGKDIKEFKKTLIRNTTSISVTFNENEIYSGKNMSSDASFTLRLYEPTETPLSWYIIVSIVLLVIFLVVFTLYSFRTQKSSKIKEMAIESEELLNTKKTLLMSLLRDVEKQHRSKQISDDTYHKLKEQYKQQAVETMKKLEDMKSKIK